MRCPGLAGEHVLKGRFTHLGSLWLVLLGQFVGQRPDRIVWQPSAPSRRAGRGDRHKPGRRGLILPTTQRSGHASADWSVRPLPKPNHDAANEPAQDVHHHEDQGRAREDDRQSRHAGFMDPGTVLVDGHGNRLPRLIVVRRNRRALRDVIASRIARDKIEFGHAHASRGTSRAAAAQSLANDQASAATCCVWA